MNPISQQPNSEPALFKGFPYILTHFTGSLYHVILLPQPSGQQPFPRNEMIWHQAWSNNLPTCVAVSENKALYFDHTHFPSPAIPVPVPRPRYIAFGKLVTQKVIPEEREILIRYMNLCLHADYLNGGDSAFYVGDLTKGGRPATTDEIDQLGGRQANGVPKGLRQCAICREWHGACLDTNIPRLLVCVSCRCQNHNRCARCGQLLYHSGLNSNFYSKEDGGIWHVPGFCATSHECPQAVESWVTQAYMSLKTAVKVQ